MKLLGIILSWLLQLFPKFSKNKSINNMSTILNFTPHNVIFLDNDNNTLFTFKSDGVARCSTSSKKIGSINTIDLKKLYLEGLKDFQNKEKILT